MSEYFVDKFNEEFQVRRRFSSEALLKLQSYTFPGNVRELQNIIKNAVVLSETEFLDEVFEGTVGFGPKLVAGSQPYISEMQYPMRLQDKIEHVEKEILSDALVRFRSTRKIAQNLGTSQSSVMRKLIKYNLSRNNLSRK